MNIVSYQCPNCSAQLRVDPENENIKCDYCGSTLWLENAFSPAMQEKALEKRADRLAEKILSLIEPVKRLKTLNSQRDILCREVPRYKKKSELANSSAGKYIPYAAGIAVLLFFLIMAVMVGSFGCFVFGAIAGAVCFLCVRTNMNQYIVLSERKEKMYAEVCTEIDQIKKENDFSILPFKYQNEDAMPFFADSLKSRRALTLQQAVNLYEDELQKREMKALQQEQIELQKAQIREMKNNKKNGKESKDKGGDININIDGLAAAGGLLAAGLTVAKYIKDEL